MELENWIIEVIGNIKMPLERRGIFFTLNLRYRAAFKSAALSVRSQLKCKPLASRPK